MNELITVNYDNEQPTVSARELHGFLEVGTRFGDWFPRMCEYGFEQGRDFNFLKNEQVRFEGNREVKRTVDDAEITIDMAKELCMLQRNDKGKQARQYFLQLERDWNSPEKVMARALQIAHKRIHTLSEKIEQDAPKVLFADSVAASHTSILIFDLCKDHQAERRGHGRQAAVCMDARQRLSCTPSGHRLQYADTAKHGVRLV